MYGCLHIVREVLYLVLVISGQKTQFDQYFTQNAGFGTHKSFIAFPILQYLQKGICELKREKGFRKILFLNNSVKM